MTERVHVERLAHRIEAVPARAGRVVRQPRHPLLRMADSRGADLTPVHRPAEIEEAPALLGRDRPHRGVEGGNRGVLGPGLVGVVDRAAVQDLRPVARVAIRRSHRRPVGGEHELRSVTVAEVPQNGADRLQRGLHLRLHPREAATPLQADRPAAADGNLQHELRDAVGHDAREVRVVVRSDLDDDHLDVVVVDQVPELLALRDLVVLAGARVLEVRRLGARAGEVELGRDARDVGLLDQGIQRAVAVVARLVGAGLVVARGLAGDRAVAHRDDRCGVTLLGQRRRRNGEAGRGGQRRQAHASCVRHPWTPSVGVTPRASIPPDRGGRRKS